MKVTPDTLAPALQADIEILAQPAPGFPDRHLLNDPLHDTVFEITAKEAFICRLLTPGTTYGHIQQQFEDTFHIRMSTENLSAFLGQLRNQGLLEGSSAHRERREWEDMKPLPLDINRLTGWLARRAEPWRGWPARILFGLLYLLGIILFLETAPTLLDFLRHYPTHLAHAGALGFSAILSTQALLQIAIFFTLLPFLREIAKATACRIEGIRVPEIRYAWFLRFIPRAIAGIHGMARLDKPAQLRILTAGLHVELAALALGLLGAAILSPRNPLYTTFQSLAIGAGLRFLFTANPFGKLDGNAILGLLVNQPDLRRRAVAMFRAALLRQPLPEPASPARRRSLILWGFACDLILNALTIAFMASLGYLLIQWMGGLGALLTLALILLYYERNLRGWIARPKETTHMGRTSSTSTRQFWIRFGIGTLLLILLAFIPYPFEVSGEFRLQPISQREIRTEISGLIDAILVQEGSTVEAGDIVARLSTRSLEKDIEITRSSLRREREHLRAMEAGARPEDIAKLQQAVRAAEVKLGHSEETLRRSADLHTKNHISDQDYQNVLMVRDLDRENLELARLTLISAEAGIREEELEAQRAVVDSIEITLRHLEDDVERSVFRSPISGRISTLYLQGRIGQQVTPGDVIAVVEDLSLSTVRIALPEAYIGYVELGARVRVRPWSHANRIFEGEVTSILPVVIERSQDAIQKAAIEQERGMVRNVSMPEDRIVPVIAEIEITNDLFRSEMTGFAKISAGWKPVGYAFFHPVIRFFTVRVWSWIP
ncbi:MAG TPA: HlyD family efflux transporter periplasmic adaptor subunit [Kiritimatiellia bacterium]|nr:HlyD family efflux transporter periplasmic adaptor subunit [Kiritimatiellia bacterium]